MHHEYASHHQLLQGKQIAVHRYFEVASGLGTLLGPIIGTGFYTIGGFQAPFFGISLIYTGVIVYAKYYFSKEFFFDDQNAETENEKEELVLDNKKNLGFCDMIRVKRSFFGLII